MDRWDGQDAGWQYIAERPNGDGTYTLLHPELPLTGVQLTNTLSSPWAMEATTTFASYQWAVRDGSPLFLDWGTVIWALKDGQIRGGGLLVDSAKASSGWSLDIVGFTNYPVGQPYTDAGWNNIKEGLNDVLDIYRYVWTWLQSKPGGNLGLQLDPVKAGVTLSLTMKQDEFDTVESEQVFDHGAVKLAWHSTPDLGAFLDELAKNVDFDYTEHHTIGADGVVKHELRFHLPKLRRRRHDLRIAIGENVTVLPTIEHDSEDYADEILCLGRGNGSQMQWGVATGSRGKRLRRAQGIQRSELTTKGACVQAAKADVSWRTGRDDISNLVVAQTRMCDIASIEPGDEVLLQGTADDVEHLGWFLVTSVTTDPETSRVVTLGTVRADKVDSNAG